MRAAGVAFPGPCRFQVAQCLVELRPQLHVLRLGSGQLGQGIAPAGLIDDRGHGRKCRNNIYNAARRADRVGHADDGRRVG